ncbi:MAG: pilus assembly protein PilM [Verrucomicrobia bacterium]|nr:pilus assembly protein PilM [Verrucomicrobiota bacterium]MDA1085653.1 pilus assembly protein PilM [Verrucomicrobiota bacterium]
MLGKLDREKVAGVHLGEDHIRAVQLRAGTDGRLKLLRAAAEPYDPRAPVDVIASTLRRFWSQHRFSTYTVNSTLEGRSLFYKHCRFKGVARDELRSAVRLEAEESLQMPGAQIAVDWHVNRVDDESGSLEAVLVAIPREILDGHVQILRMAGLYPVIIDARCLAFCNLFQRLKGHERKGTVILINLASQCADIAILYGTAATYPRTIYFSSKTGHEARHYLIENLKDVLKYYQFKLHHEPVECAFVTGVAEGRDEFVEAVQQTVGLPCVTWDPMDDVFIDGASAAAEEMNGGAEGMAVSLGLGLRGVENA